jgi:hypothetical protein
MRFRNSPLFPNFQGSIEARRPTQVPVYSPLIALIPATADSPPGEKPSAHPSLAGTRFGPYPWDVCPCPLRRVCRPAASAPSAIADGNAIPETAAVDRARGRTACRGQFLGQGRRARPAQRRNLPAMAAALPRTLAPTVSRSHRPAHRRSGRRGATLPPQTGPPRWPQDQPPGRTVVAARLGGAHGS